MRDLETVITVVSSCRDQELHSQGISWSELRELLSVVSRKGDLPLSEYTVATDAVRKEEKDGPAWIPCSVRDPACGRRQENIDQAYYMVLDLDGGTSLEVINSTLAGREYVVHSSYSHSAEKSKFRVVMPMEEPIPAKDIGRVFDYFQQLFGDNELDAACGHDPARLYYLPACPADAESMFIHEHHEGKFVDAKSILNMSLASVTTKATPTVSRKAGASAGCGGVPEGGRNNAAFKRACGLFDDGLDYDDVLDALLAWNASNSPPLEERELRGVAKSAKKHVDRQEVADKVAVAKVVDEMNNSFAWSIKQNRVYRFNQRDFVSIEALRQQYANTSLVVRTSDGIKRYSYADIWFRDERRRSHQDVDFYPGKALIFNDKINLWTGWPRMPIAGDVQPWMDLMDHFFGTDLASRKWFEQWLAYPIQHPGAKLTTAVVLWSSTQGVGKSLIGETMCKLYGPHGKVISANELHSQYNAWMREAQFVLGEENDSKDQRSDANRLKLLITGNRVYVNEKYQPATETQSCVNFLFTSNHADAFYLEDADRRFFIWEIASPRKPDSFYDNFVKWRDEDDGLPALMQHLMNVDLTGFLPYGNAPVTAAKLEMIQQSKSELERVLADILEDADSVKQVFGSEVASLEDVSRVCRTRCSNRPSETAVSRALRRQIRTVKRRVSLGKGRRHMMQSLANHDYWDSADTNEWVDEYAKLHLTVL